MIFYMRTLAVENLIKKFTMFHLSFFHEKCILDWFLLFLFISIVFLLKYMQNIFYHKAQLSTKMKAVSINENVFGYQ